MTTLYSLRGVLILKVSDNDMPMVEHQVSIDVAGEDPVKMTESYNRIIKLLKSNDEK